jgi:transposase
MHKLAHLVYGVIHNETPFDPNFLAKKLASQDGI